MDRSRQTTPNSTPGFVYFNTSSNQAVSNKNDTTEFLSFSEEPRMSPQSQQFTPSYYSSPQSKFHRGTPRSYPQNYRKPRRWSGGNRSYNSSHSYTNYSQNSSCKEEVERNISQFIHPSFLEDPWADLELQLKNKKQSECTDKGVET